MNTDPLTTDVIAGDTRAIARAISLVEDETAAGAALVRALHAHTGRAYVIGVTGAPGAGKSTLVDRLVTHIRAASLTAGVIAVDPTSPFTGGAILGDRVRMPAHATDDGVFIRSMATRGQLGGLARATDEAVLVLDAAGKDVIVIETVGVGQDEVDIVKTADISIVILVPGAGDDVQALKAGIMEIGDIFVVNKADRDGADQMVHAVEANLSLQTVPPGQWRPPVLKTNAVSGAGVDAVWRDIQRYREHPATGRSAKRRARDDRRVRDLLSRRFLDRAAAVLPPGMYEAALDRIAARELDVHAAADEIMDAVFNSGATR